MLRAIDSTEVAVREQEKKKQMLGGGNGQGKESLKSDSMSRL